MPVGVAVSGGADSLLALCLLQEQGYEPEAVHASFAGAADGEARLQEELAGICARRGIPLHCIQMEEEFDRRVIRPFVQAYARGLTPNPCSWCNQRIKFDALVREVRSLGLDMIATGHYARVEQDCPDPPGLYRGTDSGKDQSYFLALVDKRALAASLFPLSAWTKARVREELSRRGLRPVSGEESQEICFIPHNDYREFLATQDTHLPGPGEVVDSSGRVLGRHQGVHGYTLGQRRGLGIAHSEPLYVLDKDAEANRLIVGPRRELQADSCRVRLDNALVGVSSWPEQVLVQTNYRQGADPARILLEDGWLDVRFDRPRLPATPGQIAAFYSRDGRVLGGGEIMSGARRKSGQGLQ